MTEAKAVRPSACRFDRFGALKLPNMMLFCPRGRARMGGIESKVDPSV